MKVTLAKMEECATTFVAKEICPKLTDWRKWGVPLMLGTAMPTVENAFNNYRDTLQAAGFVDNDGYIDLDSLYEKIHKIAEESGDIVQEIPVIGSIRLSVRDVETFYRMARTQNSIL